MDLRAAVRFPVSCPVVIESGRLESRASIFNLSVWGCAVHGSLRARRGDRCSLSVFMPNGTGLVVIDLARVRWSTDGTLGLEFLNMTAPARARLRRFLLDLRMASSF